MKFSIIIPSFLGAYPGAAIHRDAKIHRALDSVKDQLFMDYEVIVIADGCQKTFDLMQEHYALPGWKCSLIQKEKTFSGRPRNLGIDKAQGEYIIYLDIDDFWGDKHLNIVADQLDGLDWVWFDDYIWNESGKEFQRRSCNVYKKFSCGTSNICHKKFPDLFWKTEGYLHDYDFIKQLMQYKKFKQVQAPEYYVCHIPGRFDC